MNLLSPFWPFGEGVRDPYPLSMPQSRNQAKMMDGKAFLVSATHFERNISIRVEESVYNGKMIFCSSVNVNFI